MSKLIVLRGNSGSGKTTVSKLLQEKFGRNTMLISHDMVRMQILHAKDVEALPLIMQFAQVWQTKFRYYNFGRHTSYGGLYAFV